MEISWYTVSEGKAKVSVIFSQDGGKSFGHPVQVDEGKAIGRVDIVMLEGESIMVSWMEGTTIKAAKVHADGTKDSSLIIASSSEARSSGFPQMTKSGNELFFAWTDDKDKAVKVARLAL